MQIFSRLRSSLWGVRSTRVRGFTLIELLISIGIITIITAIVLVRFRSFDSATILKNMAYEVAGSIRDAQVYAVSTMNTGDGFRTPYGVKFLEGGASYDLCRYTGSASLPYCAGGSDSTNIRTFTLSNNIVVADVCVVVSGAENCSPTRVDISFKRPEFTAYYYASPAVVGSVERAKIKLYSTSNTSIKWVVDIGKLGQVSVYKE